MQRRDQKEIYDLRLIKGFIRRRKKLFLTVASTIFISSVLVALCAPKVYVSTATILIEGQSTEEIIKGLPTSSIEERLQSINQQILSHDKLLEIIKQLSLITDFKNRIDTESAINNMRKNITIRTIKTEDLDKRAPRGRHSTVAFTLSFQGEDPSIVQQITSRLAALYIEKNIQTKELMAAQATTVLQARVNQLKEHSELSGKRLNDFKRQHAGELPESVPINLEQISRLNNQLGEINAKIKILEDRAASAVGRNSSIGQQNPSIGDQTAGDSLTRLAQLRVQLDIFRSKYSDKHPDVIKTNNEIKRLEAKLGNSSNEERLQKDSELKRYIQQRDEIERKIAELQRKNQMAPLIQGENNKLTLEYENDMKQYNETMSKLAEANLMKGIEEGRWGERFTIIDEPALPETPEKPTKSKILLAGFFLSFLIGFIVSIIRENLDSSIKSPEQLMKLTDVPVLSVIPVLKNEQEQLAEAKRIRIMKILDNVEKKMSLIKRNMREKSKT